MTTANALPFIEVAHELTPASLQRASLVHKLPKGAHIHISGVCGTGMASVLQLLKEKGFYVTGSDKAFYPPMGDVVRKTADRVFESYNEANLSPEPKLVVIGNSLSRGNPEIEYVLSRGIPFASMPEVFSALLIGTREECRTSVVVAGTHGKTTTTSAVATILDVSGLKPGYFVGGIPKDLPSSIRLPAADLPPTQRVVVLEGDEYDSAFFSKFSKFHSYRPDIAIITSLEFDHADIFSSIEDIEREFTSFVGRVPENGLVLVCDDDEQLVDLAARWQRDGIVKAELAFYGSQPDSKYQLLKREQIDRSGRSSISLGTEDTLAQELSVSLSGVEVKLRTPLTGIHNALNLLAASAVAQRLGLSAPQIAAAVPKFHGVLRRQHVVANVDGVLIIEDFAHHPTAVKVTLEGLRERYQSRRLVAVYEPRSNTSRRAFFQDAYVTSFAAADEVVLLEVADIGAFSGTAGDTGALDVKRLASEIASTGTMASSKPSIAELQSYLLRTLGSGDVVVLMSNGDFGGLIQSLPLALAAIQH